MLKHVHIHIRYTLAAVFLLCGHFLYAQTTPVEPTSATDGKVKIHNHRKLFHFGSGKRYKKIKGQARSTEREGQSLQSNKFKVEVHATERPGRSIHKQKVRNRNRSWREGHVFKHHNHFARKENNSRSRNRHNRKHSIARK